MIVGSQANASCFFVFVFCVCFVVVVAVVDVVLNSNKPGHIFADADNQQAT